MTSDAMLMTKMTAIPMPMAVSVFFDTPRKGQMPRNLARTKLLTNTALIIRRSSFPIGHLQKEI